MTRTDDYGVWTSTDGGKSWDLTDPNPDLPAVSDPDPGLTPEQLAAATTLALTLIEHTDTLTSAVQAIAGSNTAKAPLEILDTAVQAGAAVT